MLTGWAYWEAGYDLTTDPTFEVAHATAEEEGVPGAFVLSYVIDPELTKLMEVITDTPGYHAGIEDGSYEEILGVGAGCTRHFLKHALAN